MSAPATRKHTQKTSERSMTKRQLAHKKSAKTQSVQREAAHVLLTHRPGGKIWFGPWSPEQEGSL